MSRYKCHQCEAWHGTDNMVAYCASCYDTARRLLKARQEETAALAAKFAELEVAEVRYLDVTRRLEEDNTTLKAELYLVGKVLVGCAVTGCAICSVPATSGQGEKP